MMSIATAGLLVKVADLSAGLSSFLVIMLVWCLSPYALLALALHRPWRNTEAVLVAFATTIAVSGFGLYIYTVAFFVKTDPLSGLVFAFIPLWPWMGALVGLGVAWRMQARTGTPKATGTRVRPG